MDEADWLSFHGAVEREREREIGRKLQFTNGALKWRLDIYIYIYGTSVKFRVFGSPGNQYLITQEENFPIFPYFYLSFNSHYFFF